MRHQQPCQHPWCKDRNPGIFVVSTGSKGDWLISESAAKELHRKRKYAIVRFTDKNTHLIMATKPAAWVLGHLGVKIKVWEDRYAFVITDPTKG